MSHNLIIFLNSRQICHKLDITGAYVKIGYFEREADLIFQDEVHGNLFEQIYLDKLMIWNEGHLPENWTVGNLLKSHSSRPYNPDIANSFFRSGYVESWGRGISKMTELCVAGGLPEPSYLVEGSDFWVIFKKDIYNTEYLESLGLNGRQVKAVLFAKEKGKITNSDYQTLNSIFRETATRDIKELVDKKLFKSSGVKGAGAYYTLN